MSTRWRCAVCEAMNDGGQICAACGATVTQTVVRATPDQEPPGLEPPVREGPAREPRAIRIPIRRLPGRERRREPAYDDPYDFAGYLEALHPPGADDGYGPYERIDTRPRVRIYGCCLPIVLGMLLVAIGAVTLLGNLVIGAL